MPDATEITIADVSVKVPQPYSEGHKCSANEAGVLNQIVCENVRNNLREGVKKMVANGEDAKAIQAFVSSYADDYKFGERKGGGFRTADPVMAQLVARSANKNTAKSFENR